jgi:hypothetical protein
VRAVTQLPLSIYLPRLSAGNVPICQCAIRIAYPPSTRLWIYRQRPDPRAVSGLGDDVLAKLLYGVAVRRVRQDEEDRLRAGILQRCHPLEQ